MLAVRAVVRRRVPATQDGPASVAGMTFSIVARAGDAYGVAVASKFIAVGSVVPAAWLGVGAIATQAMAKVSYAADGLALLVAGTGATDTAARLTSADEGRPHLDVERHGLLPPSRVCWSRWANPSVRKATRHRGARTLLETKA